MGNGELRIKNESERFVAPCINTEEGFDMAKGDDIQDRLPRLAVGVMSACNGLPETTTGKHIAGQLLRSSTSGAPNYAEARGAESTCDFIHKLGVVLKELNETEMWLQMILMSELLPDSQVQPLLRECGEMCKIIAVSRRTARERARR